MKIISALLIIMMFAASGHAQANQARVADAYGAVEKKLNPADARWQSVNIGDMLNPSAVVRTGPGSAALLVFPDKHAFRIGERAEVQLKELGQNNSYSFEVLRGQIWSFVNKAKKPAKYEVETPSTVLGVSGTLFTVEHDAQANESEVSVADGTVNAGRGAAAQRVEKGYQLRLRRGQAGGVPQKHDNHTKQMWSTIQQSEAWTKGNATAKLNREAEEKIRALKEQRRQEQAVQQRRAQQQQQKQQKKEQKKKQAPKK